MSNKEQSRTFSLKLEKHEDGYLAYFPALRGCHTWGRTYEEAVKHAREALTLYLEVLAETGQAIPEDHSASPVSLGITVRTPTIA
jgi:antitoxin HicB